MDDKQKGRIERYLLNADRFMWGLVPGNNQKEAYSWLENKGFRFTRANYGLVVQQLLRNPGLEKLLKDLIQLLVEDHFPDGTREELRRQWNLGEHPDLTQVNKLEVRGNGPKDLTELSTGALL